MDNIIIKDGERKCIITLTPDNPTQQMNVETGNVTNLEILEMLDPLVKHFARAICQDYADLTNQRIEDLDDTEFDNYVKFLRANKL